MTQSAFVSTLWAALQAEATETEHPAEAETFELVGELAAALAQHSQQEREEYLRLLKERLTLEIAALESAGQSKAA